MFFKKFFVVYHNLHIALIRREDAKFISSYMLQYRNIPD